MQARWVRRSAAAAATAVRVREIPKCNNNAFSAVVLVLAVVVLRGTSERACLHDDITITICINVCVCLCIERSGRLTRANGVRRRVRRAHTDRKRQRSRDTCRGAARLRRHEAGDLAGRYRCRVYYAIVGGGRPSVARCLINGGLVGPATRARYIYAPRYPGDSVSVGI